MLINFPTNLKEARQSKSQGRKNKISQTRMAKDLGITKDMISSYEQGRAEPSLCLLVRMADYFELSIRELLT